MARRRSWGSRHQAADFLIGIRAALVEPGRPRGGCTDSRAACSVLFTYRTWPVQPRSVHLEPLAAWLWSPSSMVSASAAGSPSPTTVRVVSILHEPAAPAQNAT